MTTSTQFGLVKVWVQVGMLQGDGAIVWACPKCRETETFCIDEPQATRSDNCLHLHKEDELYCYKCGWRGTGQDYADFLSGGEGKAASEFQVELEDALLALLEGQSVHDVVGFTGMSEEKAKAIFNLRAKIESRGGKS